MICPFLNINNPDTINLIECSAECALLIDDNCAFKTIASAVKKISVKVSSPHEFPENR